MELELLLDDGLDVLFSETFNQVELVLEDDHAEENFSISELSLSELKLSDLSDLFHNWLDFTFELFVKSDQLESPVNREGAFGFGELLVLGFIFGVDDFIDLHDFVCRGYLWSVPFVVDYNFLSI